MDSVVLVSVWLGIGLGLLAGLPLGAGLYRWLSRRSALSHRHIPKQWPLSARLVANTTERKVWRWLSGAFFDHSVLIKMPVTRFMLPRTPEQGKHWYELLSAVYCTFTIVSAEGRVIGCIDVEAESQRSQRSHKLKETLLSQCGIAYRIVEPAQLPGMPEIRGEFLGETISMSEAPEEPAIRLASSQLRASLRQKRKTRQSDGAPPSTDSDFDTLDSRRGNQLASSWEDNSFLSPIDSRKGDPD
jgi:Protein of unknown function (DUF2726)